VTVTLGEVVAALEARYDPALAEEWDAVGLVCGDPDEPVQRVLFAVDPVAAVVDEVVETGAQLLVTHHPLLLTPVHGVPASDPKGRLVHRLVRAGAALFVAHTNADRAPDSGVNDALAAALGLTDTTPLQPAETDPRAGLGRIGRLPQPLTLQEFADLVAAALPDTVGGVRAAGDPAHRIATVAVCGGSGGSLLPAAAAAGADVLLTSDLRVAGGARPRGVRRGALRLRVAVAAGGGRRPEARPGRTGGGGGLAPAHRPVDLQRRGSGRRRR
jgi:dinuclear metal center YbgI/SA1388 family protein